MNMPPGATAPPASGASDPFAVLAANHERLEHALAAIETLFEQLEATGNNACAAGAARGLLRTFDLDATMHREDVERHVLPALREQGDDAFAAQLALEHREMLRGWSELRQTLLDVADGSWSSTLSEAASPSLPAFVALWRAHMESEAEVAFPATRRAMDADALRAMADEMARRRGPR